MGREVWGRGGAGEFEFCSLIADNLKPASQTFTFIFPSATQANNLWHGKTARLSYLFFLFGSKNRNSSESCKEHLQCVLSSDCLKKENRKTERRSKRYRLLRATVPLSTHPPFFLHPVFSPFSFPVAHASLAKFVVNFMTKTHSTHTQHVCVFCSTPQKFSDQLPQLLNQQNILKSSTSKQVSQALV